MSPRRVEQTHYQTCMQNMAFDTLSQLYMFLAKIAWIMGEEDKIGVLDILEEYDKMASLEGLESVDYNPEPNHNFRVLKFMFLRAPIYKSKGKWHIKLMCD